MGKNLKRIQRGGEPKRKRREETCDSTGDDQNRSFNKLPVDVVKSIFERLSLHNLVRAKAVSKFWNFVVETLPNKRRYLKSPWFIMKPRDYDQLVPVSRFRIMNLEEGNSYCLSKTTADLFLKFPYIGSSLGWLIFMNHETHNLILFNPFTYPQIQLPSPISPSFRRIVGESYVHKGEVKWKNLIRKAILTAEPLHQRHYGVVVICSNFHGKQKLKYYKNEEQRWTRLHDSRVKLVYHTLDILCYGNKLYALRTNQSGTHLSIDTWNLQGCCLEKRITFDDHQEISLNIFGLQPRPRPQVILKDDIIIKVGDKTSLKLCLVEFGGEILLVSRFVENFKAVVCKLDLVEEKAVRLFYLGDDKSLVLGRNQSIVLSTQDLQQYDGNCIYFCNNEDSMTLESYEQRNQNGTWTKRRVFERINIRFCADFLLP